MNGFHMKDSYEGWKETLGETKIMTKKELVLTVAVAALGGVVLGMLLSPRKNKQSWIGCNTNNNHGNGGECGCDDNYCCDGDCCCDDDCCEEEMCCCGEEKGETGAYDREECCCETEPHADKKGTEKEYVKIK